MRLLVFRLHYCCGERLGVDINEIVGTLGHMYFIIISVHHQRHFPFCIRGSICRDRMKFFIAEIVCSEKFEILVCFKVYGPGIDLVIFRSRYKCGSIVKRPPVR